MKTMTRYRITTIALLFLAFMSMAAMIKGMEVLSVSCITGMMTALSTYIWAQTKRPSREIIDKVIKERESEQTNENENEK